MTAVLDPVTLALLGGGGVLVFAGDRLPERSRGMGRLLGYGLVFAGALRLLSAVRKKGTVGVASELVLGTDVVEAATGAISARIGDVERVGVILRDATLGPPPTPDAPAPDVVLPVARNAPLAPIAVMPSDAELLSGTYGLVSGPLTSGVVAYARTPANGSRVARLGWAGSSFPIVVELRNATLQRQRVNVRAKYTVSPLIGPVRRFDKNLGAFDVEPRSVRELPRFLLDAGGSAEPGDPDCALQILVNGAPVSSTAFKIT